MKRFEPVIGLEVHAQLLTRSKMFCACPATYGDPPNSNTCPVCMGLPGALPVVNRAAVEMAVKVTLALGCKVRSESVFSRKNYFYPDLPKGYQISQYDLPLGVEGQLRLGDGTEERAVGIQRVHLEEDAGKSLHSAVGGGGSRVDFNRAGLPLIEIVTGPDFRSPSEAHSGLVALHQLLIYLGVSSGRLEEGSLRCDANVSLRPAGGQGLGAKVEVKNLNSFRNVERALSVEVERQTALLEAGGQIQEETRLYDAASDRTLPMREKEGSEDYRYFPDPDLPALVLEGAWIREAARSLPELPRARRARYVDALGLTPYDAGVLTASRGVADYFEAVAGSCGDARAAANWVMGEVLRLAKEMRTAVASFPVGPSRLASLIRLVGTGELSTTAAKEVLAEIVRSGEEPAAATERMGLRRLDDEAKLTAMVEEVLAAHPAAVAELRAGRDRALGFLVGQVIQKSGSRANPTLVNELVKSRLNREN